MVQPVPSAPLGHQLSIVNYQLKKVPSAPFGHQQQLSIVNYQLQTPPFAYFRAYMRKLFFFFATLSLLACQKDPGEGGLASIKGKVIMEYRLVLANPATVQNTVPAADTEVYIVYGDHVSPDDRIWTNPNGEFEFQFLRKGDYTIYVYSRDINSSTTIDPDRMAVSKKITIDDRKGTVDAGTFTIYDNP